MSPLCSRWRSRKAERSMQFPGRAGAAHRLVAPGPGSRCLVGKEKAMVTMQGLPREAVPGPPGGPPSLSPSPQHSLSSILCFLSFHSLLNAGGGGQVGSLPASQPAPSTCSPNSGFVCEWSRLVSVTAMSPLVGGMGADTACGLTLVNKT